MSVLQNSNAITPAADGFELKSVRSNSADSPRFTKTVSGGNRNTFTVSFWTKKCKQNSSEQLWGAWISGLSDANWQGLSWSSHTTSNLTFQTWNASTILRSTAMYSDPSAWYHIVLAMDSTKVEAAERLKLYVNGELLTDLAQSTYPSQDFNFNATGDGEHTILTNWQGSAYYGYYDGYMAEFNFIDGAQLTPASFGATNEDTNQWQPKEPKDVQQGVTFGKNGYYLPFSNNALATSFTDSSGGYLAPTGITSVEYLVVGGGGGGGGTLGGGGGAGGFRTGTLAVTAGQHYTLTVGAGGAGAGTTANNGTNGANSVFATITATGGGGGGSDNPENGLAGGSGGGGGTDGGSICCRFRRCG